MRRFQTSVVPRLAYRRALDWHWCRPGCTHRRVAPSQSRGLHISFRVRGSTLNFDLEYHNNKKERRVPVTRSLGVSFALGQSSSSSAPSQPFIGPGNAPRTGPDSRLLLLNTSAEIVHIWNERGSTTEMNSLEFREDHAEQDPNFGGLRNCIC